MGTTDLKLCFHNHILFFKPIILLFSASDGNIKLWDIKHNLCIKTLEGHSGRIWSLTPSTSEHYIVSGGADSNIIVWEVSKYFTSDNY